MSTRLKELIIISAAFFLVGVIFTYPLICNFFTDIYAQAGDPFGTIYSYWWSISHTVNFSFPYAPLAVLVPQLLSRMIGEATTYNILTILSFMLTGLAGYLLVEKITKSKWAGIFSGLVLAIAPFRIAHVMQHITFADLSPILFFIYFLFCTKEESNFKNIFLAGLFFVITTLINYQYGFMASVIFLIFLLTAIIEKIISEKLFQINRQVVLSAVIIFLFVCFSIGYFIAPAIRDTIMLNKGSKTEVISIRSNKELNVYSARWFNYVLPSPENPIFSKFTKSIYDKSITKSGGNLTEMTLYLGWIPLLLSLFGIWKAMKLKSKNAVPAGRQEKVKTYVLFFVILGLIGLYFSFAPTMSIFGWQIKTPASFIFPHLPFFRVYARFGLLVIIAAAVLAGIGLSLILERIKKPLFRYLLFVTCCLLLMIVEFANFPPFHTIDVSEKAMPEVYKFLQTQPAGTIVEYPLLPTEEPKSYDYLLWQRYHKMPLVYGAPINSEGDKFRKTLLNPQNSEVIDKLAEIGVKYLIIHQDRYTLENAKKYWSEYNGGQIPKIDSDKLDLMVKFKNDALYQIK